MIIKNQISLNIFLITCFAVTCIVSIDIFAQFLFGKNILGYSVQEFSEVLNITQNLWFRINCWWFYINVFYFRNIFNLQYNKKQTKRLFI